MATHDYVIDNQTAPNFRADLNNALLAIVSNNSNATQPAVTYANMMWYDTADNILYMRNEDNDAWIRLGTLDQTADTFAAAVSLASQAEAETGTDNTKVMTLLRVKQSVVANVPPQVPYSVNLINTLTPTTVSTVTISGLASGKSYFIEIENLRVNINSNRLLLVSFNDGSGFGTAFELARANTDSIGYHGILSFYKPSGLFNSSVGLAQLSQRGERTIPPSSSKNSNATTSIRISNSTGIPMTATAIRVYEVT